jgi:peptidoglycan/xylan/chitin deacetylase (PgdA/CDA1 family)
LAVSPSRFGEQLDVLRRTRFPLPLDDFVDRLRAGRLPRNAVAVTFDDGYADNLHVAKPRLAGADIPAILFLPTGHLGRSSSFWWDELAELILLADGPTTLSLSVRGKHMGLALGERLAGDRDPTWEAWSVPLTSRQKAYVAMHRALRPLGDQEREGVMAKIRATSAIDPMCNRPSRPLSRNELRETIKDGLITLGAHSVTHPALTGLGRNEQRRELVESRRDCEEYAQAPIRGFAYPYGDFDSGTRTELAAAGYAYGCSTVSRPVTAFSDALVLPRVQVLDWDGDELESELNAAGSTLEGRRG